MRASLLFTFATALSLAGCPSTQATCVPGRVEACPCPGGASGAQACLADSTYGPCECESPDAGTLDGGDGDAPSLGLSDAAVPSPDAPAVPFPDASDPIEPDAPGCAIPTSGFGSLEGRKLEDFTLPQCDGAGYRLYGADFCAPEHTLTVVNIAAEWCGPCQAESSVMTETLVRSYAARGVRVIQILIQDRDYGPPTLELCDRWVARYNLTDNVEVIDPTGITSGSFPSGSLPSSLIIDETGTILYREDGASDALVTLRAELDRALAGM